MDLLTETLGRIQPGDADASAAAQAALDAKTKPRGSLGRLEELACRIASVRRTAAPGQLRAAVVVAAADHGVAREGVSAYPQEVTRQMLANFNVGGAAVCVLARAAGAALRVVDAGVGTPTASIAAGPAMGRADALHWVDRGITVDDEGLARKVDVVTRALRSNPVDAADPLGVLAALGGFEIAFLVGLALGGAAERLVVVLDGFITAAAALVAARLEPSAVDAMLAAHLSPEPGHRLVLDALGLEPLLDLQMRLGEGSGATLALPLLHASLAVLGDMATFASAGVTDAGR